MKKNIELKDAKKQISDALGQNICVFGFEHREIGPHIVNILYFSYNWNMKYVSGDEEAEIRYASEVWINGEKNVRFEID